jgi:hypothetical protein
VTIAAFVVDIEQVVDGIPWKLFMKGVLNGIQDSGVELLPVIAKRVVLQQTRIRSRSFCFSNRINSLLPLENLSIKSNCTPVLRLTKKFAMFKISKENCLFLSPDS